MKHPIRIDAAPVLQLSQSSMHPAHHCLWLLRLLVVLLLCLSGTAPTVVVGNDDLVPVAAAAHVWQTDMQKAPMAARLSNSLNTVVTSTLTYTLFLPAVNTWPSRVTGRLVQDGQPVANSTVLLNKVCLDDYGRGPGVLVVGTVKTGGDGGYTFDNPIIPAGCRTYFVAYETPRDDFGYITFAYHTKKYSQATLGTIVRVSDIDITPINLFEPAIGALVPMTVINQMPTQIAWTSAPLLFRWSLRPANLNESYRVESNYYDCILSDALGYVDHYTTIIGTTCNRPPSGSTQILLYVKASSPQGDAYSAFRWITLASQ